MTDQAKPVSRPWRRLLRFSVRGLIVIVLVVGGWLGWIVRSARIQREAVAAIRKTEGLVLYDWQWKDGREFVGGGPSAPKWLVNTFGADYFNNVAAVCLIRASEEQLIHVGKLGRIQNLMLSEPDMPDAWLAHLTGLTNLSQLFLYSGHVTDAGLAHLEGLTNLSELDLACPQVSDAGLAQFEEFVQAFRS